MRISYMNKVTMGATKFDPTSDVKYDKHKIYQHVREFRLGLVTEYTADEQKNNNIL